MNAMNYRNYLARIEFDAADRIFVGHIAGINDVIGFHGAFHNAVDDYIDTCATIGKSPEKPYSGRVMFRVDPGVHARAALAAQLRGVSLNQWAEEALANQARADLASV
jgi:predicted HicB family RNase H-like nuclease